MDQRVQVVTTTQELCHRTRNFEWLMGEYLDVEGPLSRYMSTCMQHIERFKRKHDKTFAGKSFFGEDIPDRIHKQVQVFLQSCNMMCLDDMDMGSLSEFINLQRHVERGNWITPTTIWVEFPTAKEEERRNSDSGSGGGPVQTQRNAETKKPSEMEPQIRVIKRGIFKPCIPRSPPVPHGF